MAKNETPKTEVTTKKVTTFVQGLVQFGQVNEDNNDTPFIWGTLISANPCDAEGNTVNNPASFMVYSFKGIKSGDMEQVVLIKRSIEGLYDLVHQDNTQKILDKLKITIDDIPEIPVVEAEGSGLTRAEARERARERRMAKNEQRQKLHEAKLAQLLSNAQVELPVEAE